MIKLKYDQGSDSIEMSRDKNVITLLSPEDFGSLIREVKRIMEEAIPVLERKRKRKEERTQLINQLKIMVAIRLIDLWRSIKKFFNF